MFELLSKSIQRKLNLIAYLLDHPTSPPSIHFLMDYLNITYPTLKHDISELNELFDQYFNITITKFLLKHLSHLVWLFSPICSNKI